MLKKIKSPALNAEIPVNPVIHIDSTCVSGESLLIDKTGNTYECSESISMWTDGISNGDIYIGLNLLNQPNSAMSFFFQSNKDILLRPLILGNRNNNGLWLEIQNGNYFWRRRSGVVSNGVFKAAGTFGIVRQYDLIRFYFDGSEVLETSFSLNTENSTSISIEENDKINNFFIYNRTLSAFEMNMLYLTNCRRIQGLDSLGYMNTTQQFSIG